MTDPQGALVALLNRPGHAPMSAHDPRDGSCQSCPWPLHEMPPEDIADAILLAGWTPPTVKPSVEALADALMAEGIDAEPGELDLIPLAERLLALLPGRTEAEVYREGYDQGLRDAASVSRSEATVKAEALREAVRAMRAAWDGSWNLRDPRDPEVAYSVDRWLEVSADRIEKGEGRG